MSLSGPFRYHIKFDEHKITEVASSYGRDKFFGPASKPGPKLYVVSDGNKPIYVGQTVQQRLRARLNLGFQSDGTHGYHGYAWRHKLSQATIDVWLQEGEQDSVWIETVEAEIVFLIRKEYGQWPEHQTEIHFHPSGLDDRATASEVLGHYLKPRT